MSSHATIKMFIALLATIFIIPSTNASPDNDPPIVSAFIDSDDGLCDYNGPLYCSCRPQSLNCYVASNNLTINDPIWHRFQYNKNITHLQLSGFDQSIDYMPTHILHYFSQTIKQLDFQKLSILALKSGSIEKLPNLDELSISHCAELQYTQPGSIRELPNLRKISISYTKLYKLEPFYENAPNLKEIYLDNNQITEIKPGTFSESQSLEILSFITNKLGNGEREWFAGLSSLIEIDFTQNRITSLPQNVFAEMPALKRLYLTENLIENIHPNAFAGLLNIQEINLSNNRISQLPSMTVFSATPKLELLDLSNNRFEYLNGEVFYRPNLKRYIRITVRENPLQCTCGLLWMEEAVQSSFDSMIQTQLSKIYCKTDKLKDAFLLDYFNRSSPKTVIDFIKDKSLMDYCRRLTTAIPPLPNPPMPEREDDLFEKVNDPVIENSYMIDEDISNNPKLSVKKSRPSSASSVLSNISTICFILFLKFLVQF